MNARTKRGGRRGYTITELLMSLSVLAVGVAGVIAMQRVTLAANRHAKEVAIATRVAQAWADQLTADGMLWTVDASGNSTLANTAWLKKATPTDITGTWFTPTYSDKLGVGPAFGALGQPVKDPTLGHFCANLRLAFLQSETTPTLGNGLLRGQVRVFWRREDAPVSLSAPMNDICDVSLDTDLASFHVVYVTTAIRQLPSGRPPPAGP